MTSIDYDLVFSNFLGSMTDYNLADKSLTEAYGNMTEWLHKVGAKPYFRNLFTTLTFNDSVQKLTFEMVHPSDENSDIEFICELMAKGMIIEWLRPQVNTVNATMQFFGGSEQKFYSQANHLNELRALLSDAKTEFAGMIRDRGAIYNSYLED